VWTGNSDYVPASELVRQKVRFFARPEDLRSWFEKNHARAKELWIGYYKRESGKSSVTYKEALEEALCFGWIDGQVQSMGEESYANRYTPRRPGSTWSKVNIAKAKQLTEAGRMRPAGARAFETRVARRAEESTRAPELDEVSLRRFQGNDSAWRFYRSQAPSYQRVSTLWVMSAKTDETRNKRLEVLIEDSSRGQRTNLISPYSRKRTD
jgi:uncharacterized protein YdeI (YjbR/CyaY-like superfamily)